MDNITLLKYFLIMIAAPIWVPFMKELWRELQLAMREDGGLFAPVPDPKKRREIHAALAKEPSPQIHILKGHLGARSAAPQGTRAAVQPGPQLGQRGRRTLG
ncbi:MAG TPA: hypothetical protein P5218_16570, partial [Planctomycetota bacterium]|nr:hypothetical protein [Planctomycetota bacterium]